MTSKTDSFFDFVPKQSKTSDDQPASSNPIRFNVSGAQKVWTDPVKEKDKIWRRKEERQRREAHKNAVRKSSETYIDLKLRNKE